MLKKMDYQQLASMSPKEIESYKAEAEKRKVELENAKVDGVNWTPELQEELDEIVLSLVDVEEVLEEKGSSASPKNGYVPAPGTEDMVHLSIVQGRRFNPTTGKEESIPYNQIFSFGEWQLFKKHHKGLGYSIMAVLHDPYGEAKDFVVK